MKTPDLYKHLSPIEQTGIVLMSAIAFFMNILDSTIVNVSIPTIAGNMGVSSTDGTVVITSYSISLAVSTLIAGFISRKVGSIYAFCIATLLFGFFSFMCGAAANMQQMVIYRILQGAVAGPVGPTCFLLLRVALPPKLVNMGTALFGMVAITAPALGPYIGGILTDNFGWPTIFYINVPFAIISAFGVFAILKKENDPVESAKFDYVGFGLISISVSCLQILLDKGKDLEWFESTLISLLALTSLISFLLFMIWQFHTKNPLINFALFKSRNFVAGGIFISIFFLFFMGAGVLLPIVLETVMGYTTEQAGEVNLLLGVSPFFLMPIVARMMSIVDLRHLIMIAGTLAAFSIYWRSIFYIDIDFTTISIAMLIMGAGVSFLMPPLMQIIVSDFKGFEIIDAQSLTTFARTMTGGFGTSLASTMFSDQTKVHMYTLLQYVSPTNINFDHYTEVAHGNPAVIGYVYKLIQKQAMLLASADYYVWSAACTFGATLVIYFAKRTIAKH